MTETTTQKSEAKEQAKYRGCKLMQCSCRHPYQDRLYGNGIRVCNPTGHGGFRCTVCGSAKQ